MIYGPDYYIDLSVRSIDSSNLATMSILATDNIQETP